MENTELHRQFLCLAYTDAKNKCIQPNSYKLKEGPVKAPVYIDSAIPIISSFVNFPSM